MGSRGSFLENGGFSTPARWHTVDYIDGIKVLAPKDPKSSMNLPERSNTPGTFYLLYRKNGDFDQLRVFGENRVPQFDIDYGVHDGKNLFMYITTQTECVVSIQIFSIPGVHSMKNIKYCLRGLNDARNYNE